MHPQPDCDLVSRERDEELKAVRNRIAELEKVNVALNDMVDGMIERHTKAVEEKQEWRDHAMKLREALELARLTLANYFEATRHMNLDVLDTSAGTIADAFTLPMPDSADTAPVTEAIPVALELTYKNGDRRLIDRAPDSFELRECSIRPLVYGDATTPTETEIRRKVLMNGQITEKIAEYLYGHTRAEAEAWAKEEKFECKYSQAEDILAIIVSIIEQG